MEQEVLTPITQALKEGALSRRELKQLMRRSNLPGLLHLAVFIAVLLCTGFLVWFSMGELVGNPGNVPSWRGLGPSFCTAT